MRESQLEMGINQSVISAASKRPVTYNEGAIGKR
jgi:hypothetical protein